MGIVINRILVIYCHISRDDCFVSLARYSEFDRRSDGGSELNRDQRLNRVGATQSTVELGSKSNLTSDQM